jgi:hypothetical protein
VYRWFSGDSRPSVEAHQRALKKLAEKQLKKSATAPDSMLTDASDLVAV